MSGGTKAAQPWSPRWPYPFPDKDSARPLADRFHCGPFPPHTNREARRDAKRETRLRGARGRRIAARVRVLRGLS